MSPRASHASARAQLPWPGGEGRPVIAPKELAPRIEMAYLCANGHRFAVPFALGAEIPGPWDCYCGAAARLEGAPEDTPGKPCYPGYTTSSDRDRKNPKPERTPLWHLHDRRSMAELEQTLAESMAARRAQRAGAS